MIDTDRLELIDTGDGVSLSKCEQNLYEVLACQEDGVSYDPQRIYDAFEDMGELVEEVKRLRERLEVIEDFINDELRAFVNSNAFDHIYDAMEKKLEMIE